MDVGWKNGVADNGKCIGAGIIGTRVIKSDTYHIIILYSIPG